MNILFIIENPDLHVRHTYTDDLLMAEHVRRGHYVYAGTVKDLYFDNTLYIRPLRYTPQPKTATFTKTDPLPVQNMDMIYLRAMPPVEKDVLFATFLFELTQHPVICNSPAGFRNLNEKITALRFKKYMPPTLITSHRDDVIAFGNQHGWPIILKPLDQYQARGIHRIHYPHDCPHLDTLTLCQTYLSSVETQGSKRVYLLKDTVVGAVTYLPVQKGYKTNDRLIVAHRKAELTSREQKMCTEIAAYTSTQGILFAAVDLIDEHLLEINVTCPGGVREYNDEYDVHLEQQIVDMMVGQYEQNQ